MIINRNKLEKPLRLGVIGCGKVFENYYLPVLKGNRYWQLTAAYDISEERLNLVLKYFPETQTFNSIESFLRQSRLDTVLIATPPQSHCELSIRSLKAGLHVLVEKPMALSVEEGIEMVRASRQAKRLLWVGFNRRFREPYSRLKKQLDVGGTAPIRSLFFKLQFDSLNWKSVSPYLGNDSLGGGVLDDVASHQIDLLSWLLNLESQAVRCSREEKGNSRFVRIDYQIKFQNGFTASCSAGQGSGYSEYIECQTQNSRWLVHPAGIIKSRWLPFSGMHISGNIQTRFHLLWHKMTGGLNITLQSFKRQLEAFAIAIRQQGEPVAGADGLGGLETLKTIHACRKSLQSGGKWENVSTYQKDKI